MKACASRAGKPRKKMPDSTPKIPEEAVEATVPVEENFGIYLPEDFREELLQAAYPAIRSSVLEELLKGVEAEIRHYDELITGCSKGGFPMTTAYAVRNRLQVLLDSLASEEGER